jgi:endoglucanase
MLLKPTYTLLYTGSSWSSAQAFPTEAGPLLVKVTDPAGGTSKLIFDGDTDYNCTSPAFLTPHTVHKYLDSDNSGTHSDCVTVNPVIYFPVHY